VEAINQLKTSQMQTQNSPIIPVNQDKCLRCGSPKIQYHGFQKKDFKHIYVECLDCGCIDPVIK